MFGKVHKNVWDVRKMFGKVYKNVCRKE